MKRFTILLGLMLAMSVLVVAPASAADPIKSEQLTCYWWDTVNGTCDMVDEDEVEPVRIGPDDLNWCGPNQEWNLKLQYQVNSDDVRPAGSADAGWQVKVKNRVLLAYIEYDIVAAKFNANSKTLTIPIGEKRLTWTNIMNFDTGHQYLHGANPISGGHRFDAIGFAQWWATGLNVDDIKWRLRAICQFEPQ